MQEIDNQQQTKISILLINLLKGIVYKDSNSDLWQTLQKHSSQVRDYFSAIGLAVNIDENEGYAWLTTKEITDEQEKLPRLITRRQLSYPVSLLIALFRKKFAELDASGETRLILSVEEVAEMSRTYLLADENEAKFVEKTRTWLKKIAELGFIRKLSAEEDKIEVCRIIKAFVDAQWLNEFDARLQEYIDFKKSDEQEAVNQ